MFTIPNGKLADDAMAKSRRELLRLRLLNGIPVSVGNGGNAMNDNPNNTALTIPAGKLADDELARQRREILRQKLLNGGRVVLRQNGSAMGGDSAGTSISIPAGKLAAMQWYEKDPDLLEAEKMVMHRSFPNFELGKLDDGRLYWLGKLNVGVYES